MSIFDVLKYPISEPPTEAELEALPTELYNEWVSKTGWSSPTYYKEPDQIVNWYNKFWNNSIVDITQERNELTLLKQMIKDYEHI